MEEINSKHTKKNQLGETDSDGNTVMTNAFVFHVEFF